MNPEILKINLYIYIINENVTAISKYAIYY